MKRTTIRTILVTIALTALVVVVYLAAVDTANAYESTEATPCPPATVVKVRAARAAAVKAWREDNRARSCFTRQAWARPASLPARAESEAAWREAWSHYRSLTHQYRAELKRLRHKMTHPGGSSNGVRWRPLMRWVGWPEGTLANLCYIVMRESSGRAAAVNSSSGCTGLLQILKSNVAEPWRLTEPEYNLAQGLRLYRLCGWSPWAL